jgi:hypothetical protein
VGVLPSTRLVEGLITLGNNYLGYKASLTDSFTTLVFLIKVFSLETASPDRFAVPHSALRGLIW